MADFGVPIELTHKIKIQGARPSAVQGPYGTLFLRDLPVANTQRWVIRRKAEVVAAIRGGLLSRDEAILKYSLTEKELTHWESLVDKGGVPALRATRIQDVVREAGSALRMLEFASATDSIETFGNLSINYAEESVFVDGAYLHLTSKEYQMLELTILLRSDAVSKEAYLDYLYRDRSEPELKIIDVFMCKVRKKLRSATGVERIENVWGRGYKFKN